MVWLGAQPGRGRFMAAFAHRLPGVNCSGRSRSQTIACTHVTCRTLAGHRHVCVECPRIPAGVARAVAGVTVVDGHSGEGCIGNVVRRSAICRRKRAGVACRTLPGNRYLTMVPLGGPPGAGAVTARTVCSRGDVRGRLAGGRAAVVARGAIGRGGKQSVVRFGTGPCAGGLVATLTNGLPCVNRAGRARSQPISRTHMARGALAGHWHVRVECTWIPAGKACPVAGVTVGDRYPRQRFVGNVVRGGAVSWRKASGMARGTLFGHHHLAMVPATGLPRLGAVAGGAVCSSGDMRAGLACRGCSVVAACTIRGGREATVVHSGGREPCICLVARAASRLRRDVTRGLAGGGGPVVAAGATALRNPHVIEAGARKCVRVMAGVARLLRRKVIDRFRHIAAGQTVATDVAACTVPRCSLEDAVHMAGLTSHSTVLTQQSEACLDVVKLGIRGLRVGVGQSHAEQGDEQQNMCQEPRSQPGNARCHAESPVDPMKPTLGLKPFHVSTPWHWSQRPPNCPSCTSSARWHVMQVPDTGAAGRPLGAGD